MSEMLVAAATTSRSPFSVTPPPAHLFSTNPLVGVNPMSLPRKAVTVEGPSRSGGTAEALDAGVPPTPQGAFDMRITIVGSGFGGAGTAASAWRSTASARSS